LGEVDGESNDSAESHINPGRRQRIGPDSAESDVLRDEREGESTHVDALQSRAAGKTGLEARGCFCVVGGDRAI
jgi:hypothetical protein